MKKENSLKKSLFFVWQFLSVFLLVAFVVSCCFLLFFHGANIPNEVVQQRAQITFFNVLVLSLIFTGIDFIRRKLTVERPVKRILDATHRITHGDLSARIEPSHTLGSFKEFDAIIADFNQMAQELSGIETLRTDFIANVSHELKTPLAVIQNYSTMLQNPALPKELQTEYAKTISAASKRLSDLITNILKLDKLENQQIFPENTLYNLSEQLCECLLGFEDIWDEKELAIETDLEEDVRIKTDAELLSLVWSNLFSNAVKFTEAHGKVCVGLKTEQDMAVVTITDTGCGMGAETGQHIFEKFYQGDTSHATQGNGLGLALVKRVIDIVGGEISVASELGKGSTFTIRLPRNYNGAV